MTETPRKGVETIGSPSAQAETSAEVRAQITDADILEHLISTDFNSKVVASRLEVDKSRVLAAVAANYTSAAAAMRALRLVALYEQLQAADVALDINLDKMDPDDLVKAHSHLQSSFNELTKPAGIGGEGQSGFNLNVFLGKLPQRVRGNVEQLVDMDDAEFERITEATLIGPNEGSDLAA